MTVTSFAPAKVNLYLHVGPPREDGLHPLDSLVVFATDVGDFVSAAPASDLSLEVQGPFAGALADEPDNLVLRAARLLADAAGVRPMAALHLQKALPIASGIGGGSADAAAALRTLNALWGLNAGAEDLERLGAKLGADVPCCIQARACRMQGVGEVLAPAIVPPLAAVLVNPGALSPTGAVYKAFDAQRRIQEAAPLSGDAPSTAAHLIPWLRGARNDLEQPAGALTPVIQETLEALQTIAPDALVRLSGSGATVFGLFADPVAAERAAQRIAKLRPLAWVRTALLGSADVSVAHRSAEAAS